MKLIIQIPCLNEEKTLGKVLSELPTKIEGIKKIEVQIIDDGSSDKTSEIAHNYGCRVIKHKKNLGLGTAFKTGLEVALENGADILVNTDADNQYPSKYIPALVKPIVNGTADMVIGNRKPWKVKHFSIFKRIMQRFGNFVVRNIAGGNVPDTVSGFRAYGREAMLKLNVTTQFSYVLDTIVQATHKGLKVVSIPISTNAPTRKSRLFNNIFEHMYKSGVNVLRCFIIYEPFKLFFFLSVLFSLPGFALFFRYLYFYFFAVPGGRTFSLIIMSLFFIMSIVMIMLGVVSMLVGVNRKLIEYQLYLKKKELYK